jgi:hypothetical protein
MTNLRSVKQLKRLLRAEMDGNTTIYRVFLDESSILWEVIASAILRKKFL